MRGKKAKGIRREVYGDFSIRDRKYVRTKKGTIISIGRRRAYKRLKALSGA